MSTYIIRELQTVNSTRAGVQVAARTLTAAKRAATRTQMFRGTVLVIEDAFGSRLSVKRSGVWEDDDLVCPLGDRDFR